MTNSLYTIPYTHTRTFVHASLNTKKQKSVLAGVVGYEDFAWLHVRLLGARDIGLTFP